MIEVEDLSYKYKNEVEVLKNINLKIKEGEVVSIIGKNGSGKSTLAKLIAGITKPTNGKKLSRQCWYKRQKGICKFKENNTG